MTKKEIHTIYPNLNKWCEEKEIPNLFYLAESIGIPYSSFVRKMLGKNELRQSEIELLLNLTNMKYELLFQKNEEKRGNV